MDTDPFMLKPLHLSFEPLCHLACFERQQLRNLPSWNLRQDMDKDALWTACDHLRKCCERLRAKYPYLGVRVKWYFTLSMDSKKSATHVIQSKLKTKEERAALTALYPNAKITSYKKELIWYVYEFCYERLQSKLEVHLVEWGYIITVKIHIYRTVKLQMPNRFRVKVWMEGQGGGVEPPSFVLYQTQTNLWQSMELLTP